MNSKRTVISAALLLALLLAFLWWVRSPLDRRTAAIFAGATRVEVFRIDGGNSSTPPRPIKPGDPTIGGYAILSRGYDQGPEFAAKLKDILSDKKTYTDKFAKCFWPGVAFRVWKDQDSVDVIICYTCRNFYLGPPSNKEVRENATFIESPNTGRLIQLAKEAFPNDEEVQAIKEE